MRFSKSLVAASSRPLILGTLQKGPSYGYDIIQQIKELSGGQLEWAEGMLYPVLHRLEKEGLVSTEWILSENGRHRKYYALTDDGKKAIHLEKEQWMSIHQVLTNLWLNSNDLANG